MKNNKKINTYLYHRNCIGGQIFDASIVDLEELKVSGWVDSPTKIISEVEEAKFKVLEIWSKSLIVVCHEAIILSLNALPEKYPNNPFKCYGLVDGYQPLHMHVRNALYQKKGLLSFEDNTAYDEDGIPIVEKTLVLQEDFAKFLREMRIRSKYFELHFPVSEYKNRNEKMIQIRKENKNNQSVAYIADKKMSSKLRAANDCSHYLNGNPDFVTKHGNPKSAAIKFLKANYQKYFSLISKTGGINKSAIEQIAKVVNWQPQGGAKVT